MDKTDHHLESLAKFNLSFEHNVTWSQAKQAVKARTASK